MSIEWFRDLAITVFAFVATAVLVLLTILTYSLYRQAKACLESAKSTSAMLERISSRIGGRLAALVQVVTMVEGISKGVETVADFVFRATKGGKSDEQ